MYGGRCNGTQLHVRAEDGEKIHYVDFTSLYPSVLRDERYPVDHPEIITGDFKPLDQYFGLAYVKILPPARLYHPVLGEQQTLLPLMPYLRYIQLWSGVRLLR